MPFTGAQSLGRVDEFCIVKVNQSTKFRFIRIAPLSVVGQLGEGGGGDQRFPAVAVEDYAHSLCSLLFP